MRRSRMFWCLALLAAAALAAGTHADFLHDLAMRESGMDPTARNRFGYIGLFQMGEPALQDAGYYQGDGTRTNDWTGRWTGAGGIRGVQDFLSDPEQQLAAVVGYHNRIVRQIEALGLRAAIGRTINGMPLTLSGLLAGAHLVGVDNLQRYIDSNGAVVPRDGNGIAISAYISQFGGYDIGSSSPGYLAVVSAVGSTGLGTLPPPPGSAAPAVSPVPFAVGPQGAFGMATGVAMPQVKLAIGLIITSLLFVWLAWTALSLFSSWRRHGLSLVAMQGDLLRGAVLLSVITWLVN